MSSPALLHLLARREKQPPEQLLRSSQAGTSIETTSPTKAPLGASRRCDV
jgi:hypothetical protein